MAAGHRLDARLTRERDEARSAEARLTAQLAEATRERDEALAAATEERDAARADAERMLADRDRWQASARLWAELHRLSMLTLREWVDAAWRLSVTHNEPACRAKAEVALRALDAWLREQHDEKAARTAGALEASAKERECFVNAGHNWARAVFQARTKAALSQNAVEVALGLSHGYVSHIEAGRRVPSLEVLESIADTCGIRLADLVTLAESRRPAPSPIVLETQGEKTR